MKHFSREFAAKFMQVVRDETDNPDMMAVGEFWKDSEGDLNAYLDSFNEQFSVFDTPLHVSCQGMGPDISFNLTTCGTVQLQGDF